MASFSGTAGNDTLNGTSDDDFFVGGQGNDTINGGGGVNAASYGGPASRYTVTPDGTGGFYVQDSLGASGDGSDRLTKIQWLQFSDQTVTPDSVAVGATLTATTTVTTLIGAGGSDTLNGGPSADTLVGGVGNDTYYVNTAADIVTELAGGGNDVVYVSSSNWIATAGSEIERVIASGTANINLTGNGLAIELDGNSGINALDDAGGPAVLVGGSGNDTYTVRNAATVVVEMSGEGTDTVKTTLGSYTLTANVENLTYIGSGNFVGTGNGLANTITGGLGNDTLIGGGGVARLVGGAGNDTYVVDNASQTVVEVAGGGYDTELTALASLKAAANVEALTYTGSAAFAGFANDTGTYITGGAKNDTLTSGAGADTFDGAGGTNTVVYQSVRAQYTVYADSVSGYWVRDNTSLVFDRLLNIQSVRFSDKTYAPSAIVSGVIFKGTAGADVMTGGSGSDLFYAGGGDTINGVSGTDTAIYAGAQSQYAFYGDGSGGYYVQTLASGLDPTKLDHLVNVTNVQFSDQSVQPNPQTLAVFLKGTAGADALVGGAGNDVFVGSGGDAIDGAAGTNTVFYSGVSSAYTVLSDGAGGYFVKTNSAGNALALLDHLTNVQTLQFSDQAASASSLVVGQLIKGNGSTQTLIGGAGNDLIFGGMGDTNIDGGAGINTAVYSGPAARYTVYSDGGSGWFVQDNQGGEGNDHLANIQFLQFTDTLTTPGALAAPFNGASIAGTSGADTLVGTSLNDYISGFGGGDAIDGGGGLDTVVYAGVRSNYTVRGDGTGGFYVQINANGNAFGLFDHLTNISLLEFHDGVTSMISQSVGLLLTGTAGADVLTGGLGADLFVGRGGGDTINGNAGINTVIYQGTATQYSVYGDNAGGYFVQSNASGSALPLFDHLSNIQYLQFDDGTSAPATLAGGLLLYGTSGGDQLTGGMGNDLIAGGGGGDVIDGGAGVNTAVLAGPASQYFVLADAAGNYYVRDNAATPNGLVFDKLSNIQMLQFNDQSIAAASAAKGLLINGSAGADTLVGGAGNDLIFGGAGNDTIDGGAGINTAAYSGTREKYNVYQDGMGGWFVASHGSAAGDGLDHLSNIAAVQFSDQTVDPAGLAIGTAYVGSTAAETITAGTGNDLLIGGEGGDLLDGGAGIDTAVYAGNLSQYQVTPDGTGGFFVANLSAPSTPDHLLNIEYLRFGTQTVGPGKVATGAVLTAAPTGSTVIGSGGNDSLIGGNGNDTLIGGGGQDNLDGGAGVNTAVYSGAAARYQITPDGFGGFYVVDSQGAPGDGTDHISNIQYLNFLDQAGAPSQYAIGAILTGVSGQSSLIGSTGADTLNAGPDAQTLIGGAGSDIYNVNRSDDIVLESTGGGFDIVNVSAASWTATAGSEIERIIAAAGTSSINLTGNSFSMELNGNAGANILDDGGAADTLLGFGGNDTYIIRNAGTTVVETASGGNDTIKTSLASYVLPVNIENLTFTGNGSYYGLGNNTNNVLTGGLGAGTLNGGGGNDTFVVFNSNTVLIANGGNQTVVSNTNFQLPAGFNTLKLFGVGQAGAALTGVGNDAGDVFIGDSNKQVFIGGTGNDIFSGGGGADVFSIAGPHSGNDIITDFVAGVGGSIIRLSADGFTQFSQIQSNLSQLGADTVLTLSPTDSVTLKNVQVSSLTAGNFLLPLNTSNLTLTFNDDFNTLSLTDGNTGTWSTSYGYLGAGPLSSRTLQATGEQQIYVDSAYAGTGSTPLGLDPFSINTGVLAITANATPAALQSQLYNIGYTSGLLTTQTSFAQTYGYFEMRAQMPTASGAWPAFWLLPAIGTNPPELDILEASGANPALIKTTAHDVGLPGSVAGTTAFIADAGTAFHTYGLLWAPDYVTWYIDGAQVYQIATPADMNQPMYMLLNLAVGGGFGGTPDAQGLASSPFLIDYVRAYGLNGVTVADYSASTTALASDGRTIPATSTGADTIVGGSGFLDAFEKNSELNGRNGLDTVTYTGPSSQYTVYSDGHGGYFLMDKTIPLLSGGAEHLVNIEFLQFSDKTVSPASVASGTYLQGTPSADVLNGTSGDDIIFGYSGTDTLNGGDGNDLLMGGVGTDQIDGGAGINTAVYFGLHNQYYVFRSFPFDGSYNVVDRFGYDGNDHLVNIQYIQFQDGLLPIDVAAASVYYTDTGSNNFLQYGIGWDVITGGANDTIDGGDGTDTAVYVGAQSRYQVFSDGRSGYWVEDSVTDATGIGRQHLLNFENAQFNGGIVGLAAIVTGALLIGGAGADVLTATMTSNYFIGGGGNDTIDGASSTTSVVRYAGLASQYQVYGDGTGGYYVVDPTQGTAGSGVDHLIGHITGLAFSDQTTAPVAIGTDVNGTAGADVLTGGTGNDLILGGGDGDTIDGGSGFNTVLYAGASSQYTIYKDSAGGYDVANNATPGQSVDRLININAISFSDLMVDPSTATAQLIRGTAGADTLTGGAGNDRILGGGGGDTIDGGAGINTVIYSGASNQYTIYKDSAGGYDVANNATPGQPMDRLYNVSSLAFSDLTVDPSTATAQLIRGTAGADTLTGGAGNDLILGGGGGDTIDGGAGVNTVIYSGASSQYTIYRDSAGGFDVANAASPGQPMDRLYNISNLGFSDGTIDPSTATAQLIRGTVGADTLTGGAGNDLILGGGGGDTIDGGAGLNTVIYAGASSQYFIYKDSAGGYDVTTTPGLPMDRLFNVSSLGFSDLTVDPTMTMALLLRGTAGADTLTGGAGNDLILGGGGGDVLNGLGGVNTAVYGGKQADYTVFADGTGGAWVQTNSAGPSVSLFDHLLSVQSLQFVDGVVATSAVITGQLFKAGAGTVTVTGTAGNDVLVSGGGLDTLIGGAGNDVYYIDNSQDILRETNGGGYDIVYTSAPWVVTAGSAIEKAVLTGTGNFNLTGNALAMELNGNAGINTLSDGGAPDLLKGGLGNDTYVVTHAGTVVVENAGEGIDTVKTTLNSYTLTDNVENLTFNGTGDFVGIGNATNGTLTGGLGNDTLISGTGIEKLVGGGGHDTFYINNTADTVVAGAGGNSIIYTSVSGIVAAANVSTMVYTGTGNFTGYANAGGTTLVGGAGNDTLNGAAGNDVLDGGAGNNILTGNGGADVFKFAAPNTGITRLTDFVSGTDQIQLGAAGFHLNSTADFTFVSGTAPVTIDNHPSVLYNTTTGNLYFDPTGGDNQDLVQIAVLSNHPLLTAHDFIVA